MRSSAIGAELVICRGYARDLLFTDSGAPSTKAILRRTSSRVSSVKGVSCAGGSKRYAGYSALQAHGSRSQASTCRPLANHLRLSAQLQSLAPPMLTSSGALWLTRLTSRAACPAATRRFCSNSRTHSTRSSG